MRFLPLIFVLSVILLHRPLMLLGTFANATTVFTRWDFALLASAFLFLQWEPLMRVLHSFSKWEKLSILLLLFSALGHFFFNGYYTLESLGLNLVFLTVSLFGCVNKAALLKILPSVLGWLWLLNSLIYPVQRIRDVAWVGISGNWNWNATLILVLAPFALYGVRRNSAKLGASCANLFSIVIVAVSLFLFFYNRSRAALIALVGASCVMLLLYLNPVWKKRLLIAGAALLLCGVFCLTMFFSSKIDSFMASEIRSTIWESSAKLLMDNPLGVGAESFEIKYIPYKTMEYFMNPHAALRTIHPHNELLHIAILLGIPALLAWCYLTFKGMLLFAKRFRYAQMEMKLIFWGFLLIFIHSMLDLSLFAWPLDMLGFLFCGMLWAPLFRKSGRIVKFHRIPQIIGWIVLFSVLLSGWINLRATMCFEAARQADAKHVSYAFQKEALAGAELSSAFPEQLYMQIQSAILSQKDYALGLKLAGYLEKTPYREFARIHGLKALAYGMLNRDEDAIREYLADAAAYPHLILPWIGAINACGRLGWTDKIPVLKEKYAERVRLRGLSDADVRFIMQYPECDERQVRIREIQEELKNPKK